MSDNRENSRAITYLVVSRVLLNVETEGRRVLNAVEYGSRDGPYVSHEAAKQKLAEVIEEQKARIGEDVFSADVGRDGVSGLEHAQIVVRVAEETRDGNILEWTMTFEEDSDVNSIQAWIEAQWSTDGEPIQQ